MAYTDQQKKAHIRELQQMLRRISYYNPAIPRITPDGIYGKATADAVRDFQQFYGLTANSEVSSATWEKIAEIDREYSVLPEPLQAFPRNGNTVILPGDRSFTVSVIQLILQALSEQDGDYPSCQVTGLFDEETANAVRRFQKLCALPVTGAVDCKTWNRLCMAVR